MINHVCGT